MANSQINLLLFVILIIIIVWLFVSNHCDFSCDASQKSNYVGISQSIASRPKAGDYLITEGADPSGEYLPERDVGAITTGYLGDQYVKGHSPDTDVSRHSPDTDVSRHSPYNTDNKSHTDNLKGMHVNQDLAEDLCQECIGHCHIKLWSGVTKLEHGQTAKDKCVKDCSLECSYFDLGEV